MNPDCRMTLKQAAELNRGHFFRNGDRVTIKQAAEVLGLPYSYLKGELGRTLAGWDFAFAPATSEEDIEDFRRRFTPISREPIKAPGVYVVGFQRFIKIGTSVNVKERVAGLQTAVPVPLKTYAVLPGGQPEEASLHRRFSAYRLNGEWFRRTGRIAAWVEGGCQ